MLRLLRLLILGILTHRNVHQYRKSEPPRRRKNLDGSASEWEMFALSTMDGTAVSGVDYAGLSQQVTFSPGETEKTVVVPLLSPIAGNKFYGQLSSPSGAPLWISQGSAIF